MTRLGSSSRCRSGAVIAGPLAAWTSVPDTQYGAAALIVIASALAFIPRTVRQFRNGQEGQQPAAEPVLVASP